MPPYTLPELLAPLGRLRCLLRPACAVYGVMLAAFVAPGIDVLNDTQARETRAALDRADNPARVFAERFEGTLRRIDGELKQFVAFLPPDALSDAGARRYRKQYAAQSRLGLDDFREISSRNVVELADRAARCQPHLAVVRVSGFADGLSGRNSEKYRLLDKPFGKSPLQQALRAAA